jgi:hypothetical protein
MGWCGLSREAQNDQHQAIADCITRAALSFSDCWCSQQGMRLAPEASCACVAFSPSMDREAYIPLRMLVVDLARSVVCVG